MRARGDGFGWAASDGEGPRAAQACRSCSGVCLQGPVCRLARSLLAGPVTRVSASRRGQCGVCVHALTASERACRATRHRCGGASHGACQPAQRACRARPEGQSSTRGQTVQHQAGRCGRPHGGLRRAGRWSVLLWAQDRRATVRALAERRRLVGAEERGRRSSGERLMACDDGERLLKSRLSDGGIRQGFERGVGETQACGSGACAAVAAGIHRGLLAERVSVQLLGGELTIQWAGGNNSLLMTGSATKVFDGKINL